MGFDMSNNNPPHFLPSHALSLSLAGIFGGGREAELLTIVDVEDDGSNGGGSGSAARARLGDALDVSSGNSGAARSRSDNHLILNADEDQDESSGKATRKKRKIYHRHTVEQIRVMEELFKETPHPEEKQRQQLSKQLGLHPRQVKFWFQNRRTQIKTVQERHENLILKMELDKLKDEIKCLRETLPNASCPNCGFVTTTMDATTVTNEQQLRVENARLKAKVEKLRAMVGKCPLETGSPSTSRSAGSDQEDRSSSDLCAGNYGIVKSNIMNVVNKALEELKKMATSGDPLWVRSIESGREILNYDEYVKEFNVDKISIGGQPKRSIEASRYTGVVLVDLPRLVQSFMDVNQWKEMFPCMISKAAMVDVIHYGEGPNRNGTVQLMFAELQMLTPVVPTRQVYFIRYCKQISPEEWAIVDVSIDQLKDSIDASLLKCRKRPSGCIIEDKPNGHCRVTWVEHLECQKVAVHSLYRTLVNSGLAFGARHWMAALQLHCESLVFFMATNVPTKDSSGVATTAGRKSILKLAKRMTWSFCKALGASSLNSWTKVTTKTGEDVRVASRKNLNDPSEPIGLILCAVSSLWLPVSPGIIFDFLTDNAHRHKWDVMANGGKVQSMANLVKGQCQGNAVSIQVIKSKENATWTVQDSCANAFESMVVYAPLDILGMESILTGCDSSHVSVLPSGFSILPDGVDSRSLVLSSKQEESSSEGGTLLTVGLQVVANNSPTAKLTPEYVESISTLISCLLRNIKTYLQCEDG